MQWKIIMAQEKTDENEQKPKREKKNREMKKNYSRQQVRKSIFES